MTGALRVVMVLLAIGCTTAFLIVAVMDANR